MSEKPPNRPEAKDAISEKELAELEEAAYWAETFPPAEIVSGSPEEHAQKFEEFETLLTNFEQKHDLEALHAAIVRTYEEAKAHTVRQAARADFIPLAALLLYLREEQGVLGQHPELYPRYCAIQRAIGTLNNGELRHDMPIG